MHIIKQIMYTTEAQIFFHLIGFEVGVGVRLYTLIYFSLRFYNSVVIRSISLFYSYFLYINNFTFYDHCLPFNRLLFRKNIYIFLLNTLAFFQMNLNFF